MRGNRAVGVPVGVLRNSWLYRYELERGNVDY